jgi:phosphoglycolate phosphatase-like HAD superfamily hydrolase
LLKIIQKSSVKPEQALYVGDMAIDAQAAKRAKVRAAMVTTGSSTRKELKQQKPSRIMKRITDLLKIV